MFGRNATPSAEQVSCPVGSHVRALRPLGYGHDGIYIGDSLVVEVGGVRGSAAHLVPWAVFARGDQVVRLVHTDQLQGDEVVRRAVRALGTDTYSLFCGNCEHFATWCATGRWESTQVKAACEVVVVAGTSAAALLIVTALFENTKPRRKRKRA